MPKNVYIHIPFCKSKCKYCSFISFLDLKDIEAYSLAMGNEIDKYYQNEKIKTLYFGGGTPSLLDASILKKIINKFNLDSNCEITLEINPEDAEKNYIDKLYKIGINRLSFGSQCFNDEILKLIGRRHNSKQIINAIELAKKSGFNNINIDLIYGLPNQTLEILQNDLNIISKLDVQHISTYGLKIEENSYWGLFQPNNLPDEDLQADMYLQINDFLEQHKFKRYEISNFALKGYESKHNLNYWNNAEYYGFGISAHGYCNGIRYSNQISLKDYLNKPFFRKTENKLTLTEKLEEEIFLGFRKTSGINISKINKKFGIDFDNKYYQILIKYLPDYIKKTKNGYKLTLQGVLLSNNILSEFLD